MQNLEQYELIKRVKYRYFRALDTNDWALMKECLSDDCIAKYDGGKYSFEGRAKIIDFFNTYMGRSTLITLHQAHHPEIELISENEASGIWYLQDLVIDLESNTTLRGAGFYHDEYQNIDGKWLIKATGYERTYEEIEPRSDEMRVTNNMFMRDMQA